jgi:hypothetical protein
MIAWAFLGGPKAAFWRDDVRALAVIWEVDSSLESLLRAEAVRDKEIEVVFDAPATDWAARLTGPVVDAYLYDIHEDVERRHAGTPPERDGNGRIVGRRAAIRYYRLSYLITAWTTRAADEHRLLGQLLENLIRFEQIPSEHLKGRLAGKNLALTTAMPQPDRNASDLWTAVGGEMKPSLDVMVMVPITPDVTYVVGPPTEGRRVSTAERLPRPVVDPRRG